ncbi:methyl-accepting chemotaxis protein [Paenibacillus cremeus]|uniref:Methyl-accepting transducer domain-containing protein n=1 Tax=Paenibacillus cremeus TaxID=2163881 RepID=A0A559K6H4_9BACL|nr:methyl-accepting chemotaxis protein [Paenibacillus cremeus]TVY07729.1 hypothetical protein FPZ49_22165 [Paenibacillus cremeus]
MHPKLQELINSLETIQQSSVEDLNLFVLDMDKVVAKLPGRRINLAFEVGDHFDGKLKGSVTHTSKLRGEIVRQERGPEFLGIAYVATSVPVYDGNEVVGFFTAVASNEKADVIQKSADRLAESVDEAAAYTEQMTVASQEVAEQIQGVLQDSHLLNENIKHVTSILSFVEEVASQSHLLGLNAAILAARAGEHGMGFNVVATEIRKMADNSKSAVSNISTILHEIQKYIVNIDASIGRMSTFTQEHAASMEELSASFEQIDKTAHDLAAVLNKTR